MFALFYVVLAPCRRRLRRRRAQGQGDVRLERDQGRRLPDDAVRHAPAAGLRDRRPRRGGLLAGQVRHPDRAAAALAAGQGQRLDRGPDHRLDHPRRAARRPAGRPRRVAPAARLRPAAVRHRHRHGARSGDRARSSRSTSIAALFNLYIPRTEAPLQPLAHSVGALVRDFSSCNARLWDDKLGQISLATTTLFWGVSGNLRYIVLAWAAAALGYGTTQASSLVGVVAIGTAVGAIVASMRDAARPGHQRDPARHRDGPAGRSA